ncbi:unnamed protein product, partial [Scytosiphon promiscuus]
MLPRLQVLLPPFMLQVTPPLSLWPVLVILVEYQRGTPTAVEAFACKASPAVFAISGEIWRLRKKSVASRKRLPHRRAAFRSFPWVVRHDLSEVHTRCLRQSREKLRIYKRPPPPSFGQLGTGRWHP